MPDDTGIFDVHAHVMPFGVPALPGVARSIAEDLPHVVADDPACGRIRFRGSDFRRVRTSLWSVDARLAEMDAAGIGRQAVSPVPVALLADIDEALSVAFARWFNERLLDIVEEGGGRLSGVGMVPLPYVDRARKELARLSRAGVHAVEIGTRVGGLELDDPVLRPFWSDAEAAGTTVFVHPLDGGGGVVRRGGFLWDFGIGMPTDTAIAAGALVFGGVVRDFPLLKVVLAHGCGTFARTYPRMRLGARLHDPDAPDPDPLLRALWADTLVFDADELLGTIRRFGVDRVLVGSDHPFIAGEPARSVALLTELERRGELRPGDLEAVRSSNAAGLFGSSGQERPVADRRSIV